MAVVANLRAVLTAQTTQFNQQIDNSRRKLDAAGRTMQARMERLSASGNRAFDRLRKAVVLVNGPLGAIGARMQTLASLFGSAGFAAGGLVLSITAVTVALGKAALVGDKFIASQKRTEALLKATKGAAGLTAKEIRAFSESLALNTLASTEGVEKAAQKLLTFRKVAGTAFKETLTLAQDFASLGIGSLQSNVIQFGKALNDPITGLSALTRVGITFSEQQKEQIKLFVETNQVAKAQTIILAELAAQAGGAGAAEADGSLAGAFDTLGQRVEEFWVDLNEATDASYTFASAINSVASAFANLSRWLNPDGRVPIGEAVLSASGELANVQANIKAYEDSVARAGVSLDSVAGRSIGRVIDNLKRQEAALESTISALEAKGRAETDARLAAKEQGEAVQRAAAETQAEAKLQEEANAVIAANVTQKQKLQAQIARLTVLQDAGKLTTDQYTEAMTRLNAAMARLEKSGSGGRSRARPRGKTDEERAKERADAELQREVASIVDANKTEQQKLNEALARYLELRKMTVLTEGEYQKAVARTKEELDRLNKEQNKVSQLAEDIGNTFSSAFEQAIVGGEKFGDVMKGLFKDISSQILRSTVTKPFGDFISTGLSSILGGFFADGGVPPVGKPSIVGEKGPELFVPHVSGTVIPNGEFGGGGGPTFNVDMRGASVEAVQRLETLVRQVNGSIEGRAVRAVSDRAKRNPSYLKG